MVGKIAIWVDAETGRRVDALKRARREPRVDVVKRLLDLNDAAVRKAGPVVPTQRQLVA